MSAALQAARRPLALAIGLAPAIAAGPAISQQLGQAASAGPSPWRVAAALALCLLLAVAGAFALRLRMRGGWSPPAGLRLALGGSPTLFGAAGRRLRLIETLRVSPQLEICLFSCDQRQFVIAATPHGATVLTDDAAAGAEATS